MNVGWKFYAGDDYKYSKNDYEGAEGVAINPAMLITELPVVENAGIGWFRLTMQIDSSLRNKTIGVDSKALFSNAHPKKVLVIFYNQRCR